MLQTPTVIIRVIAMAVLSRSISGFVVVTGESFIDDSFLSKRALLRYAAVL